MTKITGGTPEENIHAFLETMRLHEEPTKQTTQEYRLPKD